MDTQHITKLIQHAALAPETWLPALSALASATNSYRGQLIGIGDDLTIPFNWVTNADPAILDHFVKINGGNASVSYRVAASEGAELGKVVAERDYSNARTRIGDNEYEDFCARFDLPFGAQTIVARDAGRMIGLALLRTRSDGITSVADRQVFAELIPHVRAAVDLQTALESRGLYLMLGHLDAINTPAVLVDRAGRVINMTPTAETALRETLHLNVARGAFRCSTARDMHLLTQSLGTVLNQSSPTVDLLLLGEGGPPLALSIYRLPTTQWSMRHIPYAIVVLRVGTAPPEASIALLRSTYGLTLAEAEIAIAMGSGHDRRAIATSRSATIGTVRQQVKAIFVKLGIHRQSELSLLVGAISRWR